MNRKNDLLSIVFNKDVDEAVRTMEESCSISPIGIEDVTGVVVDSYPISHTDEDGRMFDYGSEKSDSHEGRMTKAKLSRLARMSQSLHDRLQDGDDLPEWVQDKITTSEDRISSAFDYIDYKLSRILDT
tara:strand:- start:138 stop:524 length:387 start_codon:yes stop_codon:yes gene_type:complete